MKTYKYVVGSDRFELKGVGKDDPSNTLHYEGTVTLKVPSGMERMELNAKRADSQKDDSNVFRRQMEIAKTVQEFVIDVDVKKISNNYEIKDFDTLLDDREGVYLVGELYNLITGGMSLGNGSELVSET